MKQQQTVRDEETPLLLILWNQKWTVMTCVLIAVAAVMAYTYFSPPVWEAKATIVFPTQTPSVLGSTGFTQDSGLVASLAGTPTPLKVYKGFMESERTINFVSTKTRLSRPVVKKRRSVHDQPMESSLTVSFRDSDSKRAVAAVAAHLEALDAINNDVARPLLSDDTDVLAKKVDDQKRIVAELESRLLDFQNNAKTAPSVSVSPSGSGSIVMADPARWKLQQRELEIELRKINSSLQSVTTSVTEAEFTGDALPSHIPPAKKWRDRLVELEYQLKLKEIEYAPGSPEIKKLKEEVDATRTQLQNEVSAYIQAVQDKTIDPTSPSAEVPQLWTRKVGLEAQLSAVRRLATLAPEESIALGSIVRDLGIQTAVLQRVEQQYELARIQSNRDPSRWQVLDEPAIGDRPVNKDYVKMGAAAGVLGFMIGSIVAAFRKPEPQVVGETIYLRKAA